MLKKKMEWIGWNFLVVVIAAVYYLSLMFWLGIVSETQAFMTKTIWHIIFFAAVATISMAGIILFESKVDENELKKMREFVYWTAPPLLLFWHLPRALSRIYQAIKVLS